MNWLFLLVLMCLNLVSMLIPLFVSISGIEKLCVFFVITILRIRSLSSCLLRLLPGHLHALVNFLKFVRFSGITSRWSNPILVVFLFVAWLFLLPKFSTTALMQFFWTFGNHSWVCVIVFLSLILLWFFRSILRSNLFIFDRDRILKQLLMRHVLLEWNVFVVVALVSSSSAFIIKFPQWIACEITIPSILFVLHPNVVCSSFNNLALMTMMPSSVSTLRSRTLFLYDYQLFIYLWWSLLAQQVFPWKSVPTVWSKHWMVILTITYWLLLDQATPKELIGRSHDYLTRLTFLTISGIDSNLVWTSSVWAVEEAKVFCAFLKICHVG